MLRKVVIKNYKQFKDFEIELNKNINIIVGNNEAGKTTLFEAINLALTKRLNGRLIEQELSPYIFNLEAQNNYLEELKSKGKTASLPDILIELYFDESLNGEFKGTSNSLQEDCAGVSLKICFDNSFQQEYEKYIEDVEQVQAIPVEYYHCEWFSFSNSPFKFTQLPVKSHLISNIEHRFIQGTDKYIASLIDYHLDDSERAILALKYRQLKEEFTNDQNIKKINDEFAAIGTKISDKDVKISIDVSAKNAWESSLCLYLNDIPFKSIGKGEQNAVKIKLALKDKLEKSDIIMIEEPETSLSFSNLNKLVNHIKVCCDGKQLLINTHSSYLANKTGLDKTILLNGNTYCHIKALDESTYEYFKKLPGYDTLRMLLSKKTILVEGPSDELIVQKAYLDEHGNLPIEDGIDVISVRALAFKRFLNIAKIVEKNVAVVTDNDESIDNLKKKYEEYLDQDLRS